jgi:uncharacterized protein (TIGR01244 family)
MRLSSSTVAALVFGASLISSPLAAQQVTKETVPGIVNFARLETTVACAGAITPESVPEVKKMGFKSIVNLRLPEEPGANPEAEGAAAKKAGLNYVYLPFNGQNPDQAVADKFLDAITKPGAEPAFIHCAGGGRAASMWMIKRMVVDHWDADKAGTEATALGLTNAKLKEFAVEYAKTHKR